MVETLATGSQIINISLEVNKPLYT
jgi:hypothetical protein